MEIERRTVLQAGGILAVGGLVAACSSGSGDAAVASEAPAGSAPAASTPASTSSGGAGVAQVSDIPVGGGVIIDEPAVVITQPAEGEVKAFTAICTHQGCLVSEVVDNEIICPCHGSRFSAVDGSFTSGPATTGLTAAGVVVEGGSVVLS
jgi:nitrite reductase/ring-hydroxylating ferredoxin subunit